MDNELIRGAVKSKIPKLHTSARKKANSKLATSTTSSEMASTSSLADWNRILYLHKELKMEWQKKSVNLKKCGILLDQLKVNLVKFCYLPTGKQNCSNEEIIIARDMLEMAAEHSVAIKDINAFKRCMSQLKCHYYDYKHLVEDSPNMYKLLGLNLLYLLSANQVAEFHTELEIFPTQIIRENEYIKPILALEQYFMEGRYNKIFEAKESMPSKIYQFFMDIFLDTVRNEIGDCLEKAYQRISVQQAAKRLHLTPQEVQEFGDKRNWSLSSFGFYYMSSKTAKPNEPLPCFDLIEHSLSYARELEQIV